MQEGVSGLTRNESCKGFGVMRMVNLCRLVYHDVRAGDPSYCVHRKRRPTGAWIEGHDQGRANDAAKGGDRE